VDGIGAASGAALNYEVTEDNASTAIKSVSSVGTPTNTFTNLEAADGNYHIITHATNDIDWIYGFSVGGGRTATEATFTGYLTGANDAMLIQAYDFVGADWETRALLPGKAGSSNDVISIPLLSKHTGTGSDIGKVYIRLEADGAMTSPVLNTDALTVAAVNIGQSVGYALGRVWIDTADGVAGTESFVNGTADNKSLTLADALTVAGNLNIKEFGTTRDSTLAPAADFNDFTVYGTGYAFTLGGHDYAGTHIYHASPITGIATSAVNTDHFDVLDSIIGDVTVDDAHFTRCGFTGTVTLGGVGSGTPGELKMIECFSLIPGSSTPILDFGTGSENHNVTIADWQNGIEIQNFNVTGTGGTDLLSLSGTGQIIINANCDGGTIHLRGQWKITDNSSGAVTITQDDPATDITAILVDTGTTLDGKIDTIDTVVDAIKVTTDKFVFTVANQVDANMVAISDDATAAAVFEALMDGAVIVQVNVTSTTTTAVIDGFSSTRDDQFNGRLITILNGVFEQTDITDYVHATQTLTFTAVTGAPADNVFMVIH
jgi:hypothetical protein